MTLLAMSVVYLRSQWASSALHVLLLALGVALMSGLLLVGHQLQQRLYQDSAGIDAVVGAKGSPLQLVLSSVQHMDIPTGNIPLSAVRQMQQHPKVARAIPIALGDQYRQFRIVGSEPAFLDLYGAQLAQGSRWNAPMQAVLGAQVATQTGLGLGDHFAGHHGLAADGHAHDEATYEVVGIAAPTGRVFDRLIATDLRSVWQLHAPSPQPHDEHEHEHEHDHGHEHEVQQEVTALLIIYRQRIAALSFPAEINRTTALQAASPALELARLVELVGLGSETLMGGGMVVVGCALLAVLIGLFQAVRERRADLALFRVLGASRPKIVTLVVTEGMIIASLGTALGAALAYGALAALGTLTSKGAQLGLADLTFLPQLGALWALVLLAALLVCLIPAWQVYRMNVRSVLGRS